MMLSDMEKKRVLEIAINLIQLQSDSTSMCEEAVGEYIYRFYKNLGIKVEKQTCKDKRNNIIARIPGKNSSKCIMYIGHIDTVPIGNVDQWKYNPLGANVEKDRMYGRGSCDMKGSIACAMYVAEYLTRQRLRPAYDLLFVYNVDEENTNIGLKEYLKNPAKVDFIVVGEPTNMELAVGHRGVMAFTVKAFGKSCHAGQAHFGKNAIYGAAAIIESVRKHHSVISVAEQEFTGKPSIQVTQIWGGTKVNVIPDMAEIRIDRRLIFGENRESCEQEMMGILELAAKRTDCEFSMEVTTYCPPGKTDIKAPQVNKISRILKQKGIWNKPKAFEASCEAGMLQDALQVPVVIWGPGSIEQAHQNDEYIELKQLYQGAELYLQLFIQ